MKPDVDAGRLERRVRQLLCFMLGHKRGDVRERTYNEGFYDEARWEEYVCRRCGVTVQIHDA
jgi:hypothetical protein